MSLWQRAEIQILLQRKTLIVRCDLERDPRPLGRGWLPLRRPSIPCPPEDCGGIGGYYDLLKSLAEPKRPEHEETKAWLGDEWAQLTSTPTKSTRP